MSPRRQVQDSPQFAELEPPQPRDWRGVLAACAATVLLLAVATSTMVLVLHEKHRRAAAQDIAAISYARGFLVDFTSPDPFHANDYTDRIIAAATGKFAEDYKARINEVAVQVAQAEPTKGDVIDAGVERWNDDGSASVVAVTKTVSQAPNGQQIEVGNRWVVRVIKEGDQWKISDLIQVI